MLGYPVKRYLEKNFNLSVYVVALGDANPQKKADYIEKQIKKGYDDIVFIDDSIKNVRAVEKLQSKYPEVELNVIHTTEAEKLQNEVKRHFS
jgi:late competence protein required for DNA uptake (superfamily II DNA/RNA helicase)